MPDSVRKDTQLCKSEMLQVKINKSGRMVLSSVQYTRMTHAAIGPEEASATCLYALFHASEIQIPLSPQSRLGPLEFTLGEEVGEDREGRWGLTI